MEGLCATLSESLMLNTSESDSNDIGLGFVTKTRGKDAHEVFESAFRLARDDFALRRMQCAGSLVARCSDRIQFPSFR